MIEKRIEKLRQLISNNSMDDVLIVEDINRNYLSGFTGSERFSVITQKRLW
ncbi:aminopeptidase P family N-terminal domain-containing protein [Clostridium sp. JN-1]|jgi:Xaa-Pro aminopeptidase|uniref:aminopeptidase P family N-terminal domain-containing protein n=1 Tax=Clostridium sp. JN-1 TaxID=2483110 RepID=UPI000F0BB9A8|nr:aminopeptidase P family N-terminal domain-containing protein [Clostridium sp. JN-1]